MSKSERDLISKADPLDSKNQPSGMFNLSSVAKDRIRKKRRKRALDEQKPKIVATSSQVFVSITSAILTKALLTPLDRLKVIMQVNHLSTFTGVSNTQSAMKLIPRIIKEQGITSLYRGNMSLIYLTLWKMFTNIGFYDKFKHRLMPAGDSKYTGINNYWRRAVAALGSASVTIALTYPFELFFTRITADMSTKKQPRLYKTTFD